VNTSTNTSETPEEEARRVRLFEAGGLERWWASFDGWEQTKGSSIQILSLFDKQMNHRGYPKFLDYEIHALVKARQDGIAADAELNSGEKIRAAHKRTLKIAVREGELAGELLMAGLARLVVNKVRKKTRDYFGNAEGNHLEEFVQEGLLELEKQIQTFDLTSKYTFVLYVSTVIESKTTSRVSEISADIKIPASWERIRKISSFSSVKLERELGYKPSIEEIKKECFTHCIDQTSQKEAKKRQLQGLPKLSKKELKEEAIASMKKQGMWGALNNLEEVMSRTARLTRLDETVGEGGTTKGDLIQGDTGDVVGAAVEAEDMMQDVREALVSLPERERQVLEARYGFLDGEQWTFADIADKLDVSAERVRQICNAALKRLSLPGATATVLAGHLDFEDTEDTEDTEEA